MSLENQVLVDDLNGTIFGSKKYDIKKDNLSSNNNAKMNGNVSNTQANNMNSVSSSRINLIETIENISEGMVTNNNYSSHNSSSSSNSNSRHASSNNKNINISSKNSYKNINNNMSINNSNANYRKKNCNLINKKSSDINTNSTNINQFHPYQENKDEHENDNEEDIISDNNTKEKYHVNDTNSTKSMKNSVTTTSNKNVKHAKNEKTEKKEKKKKSRKGTYTHIPQIYDVDDASFKEQEEEEEEEEEKKKKESTRETKEYSTYEENSFVAHFYAAIFIIVGIITILHTYLDENHVLIQGLSHISDYILACLKSISLGRSLMHAVSITNAGIDKILNEMVKNYEGANAYADALKKINTEFCVLSLFTILTLFICGMFVNIICNIANVKKNKVNMNKGKKNSEKIGNNKSNSKPVLVMNRMTVEEFDDRTFTYNEIKKLHEDEDYICLKNKRAGDGVDAWNWQSRLANGTEQQNALKNGYDICSDINLSDVSSSNSSVSSEDED